MKTIRELETAFRRADPITIEDLQRFHDHMTKVVDLLVDLGPRWSIHTSEASRLASDSGLFIKNRKHREKMYGPVGVSENKLKQCGHLKTWDCNSARCEAVNKGWKIQ